MDGIISLIEGYLKELDKVYQYGELSGTTTAELSFRPALDKFFKELSGYFSPHIDHIFEPRTQGKSGRPDWLFFNKETMGSYGYVEAKGYNPNQPLQPQSYQSQVQRYLYLGNPVILTDGIDFIMYEPDGNVNSVSLCKKPIKGGGTTVPLDLLPFFQRFFKEEGLRPVSEKQLVSELSFRAKCLCGDIEGILSLSEDEAEDEAERQTIVSLNQLWKIAADSHDSTLQDNHNFASFVSQILAFGLLYAHRCLHTDGMAPREHYKQLQAFWTSRSYKKEAGRLVPFRNLLEALSAELQSPFSKLGIWYDNTRRWLSCVKLSEKQIQTPDFHGLYETFLSRYDGKTRSDFGAWYTPMCLAEYVTRFVKAISPLNLPEQDLFSQPVKIIDPCCGTGTFLEAVFKNIDLHPQSQIIGFEILPVPYALANYRISMLLAAKPADIEIVLTNTLSDYTFKRISNQGGTSDAVSAFFKKEQTKAKKLSSPPLTVILGNPPCSDSFSGRNEGSVISCLMDDFRPPKQERKARSNTMKQVVNESQMFLRWCLYKAEKSCPSVFAVIMPSAFAAQDSYQSARQYLAKKVADLWVLPFDADIRAGHKSQNLFGTRQGRLLLVGIVSSDSSGVGHIHYKSIVDYTRKEKTDFFSAGINLEVGWQTIQLDDDVAFVPRNSHNKELYESFFPLTTVFERMCSGIKASPTALLVHCSKGQLLRRSRYIADANKTYGDIKERWFSGQQKIPAENKLSWPVRMAMQTIDESGIFPYSFRPFLTAKILLDSKVTEALKNTSGEGLRMRPELQLAFSSEEVYGFAIAPTPASISTTLEKFTSFCWHLPDNDLVSRNNARIFCNRFPEYKTSRQWDRELKSNINNLLLKKLVQIYALPEEKIENLLLFYVYGMLNSKAYYQAFSSKLYSSAGVEPAIPITADKNLFEQMAKIGKVMANIEKDGYVAGEEAIECAILEKPSLINTEYSFDKYAVKGDSITLFWQRQPILAFRVMPELLSFKVSGYEVIKTWLKFHQYSYYRKACTVEDINQLFNLAGCLYTYLEFVNKADAVFLSILGSSLVKRFA